MATIKIKNLRLRTLIGIEPHELKNEQDIIINIKIKYDYQKASQSDNIDDTVNYKELKQSIIKHIQSNHFLLVEKLVSSILDLIMEDTRIQQAKVEIDKPHALRFCDSVSVTEKRTRT